MKLQYCSDLHLEFEDNLNWVNNNPINKVGDILIVAGDLVPFVQLSRAVYKSEVAALCRGFQKVFWIPGNHEYYMYLHQYAPTRCEQLLREVPNLYLVDNYTERIGRTELILSTMWSHISKKNEKAVLYGMNDFRYIMVDNPEKGGEIDNLTIADYNHLNKVAVRFIKDAVKKAAKAKKAGEIDHIVVATHYVPTKEHYPEIYAGSSINEAFAMDLTKFIEGSAIDAWIYGHHHFNQADFQIGNTQLLTNQLGYVMREEHEGFAWEKYIEL